MLRLFASAALLAAFATVAPAAETVGPDEVAIATAIKSMKVDSRETIIFVTDMHCATCAKKVSSRLFKVKGVMKVRTSVKLDVAVVTPQAKKPIDAAAAWTALQKSGYQPVQLIGPAGTFVPDGETQGPLKIAEGLAAERK